MWAWKDARGHVSLVAGLAGLAALLALAGQPVTAPGGAGWLWLRGPLGLVALLVLPGYALAIALFPRAGELDGVERVALSIGLSVAQLPLLILAVDRSPWGLSPPAMVAAICSLTWTWCAVAIARLGPLPAGLSFLARRPAWHEWWPASTLERAAVLVGVTLVAMVGLALLSIIRQPAVPSLTEFYILGAGGLAEDYPRTATHGEPVWVTVGVTNREGRPMGYLLAARQGEVELIRSDRLELEPGATWTGRLPLTLPAHGFDQRVDIVLFREGQASPYRRLQLVIDVPPPGVPTPVRVQQGQVARP
jgi:uncharacterized membrane protein